MRLVIIHCSSCCLLILAAGCYGSTELTHSPISGMVTHAGQPVPSGTLRMVPDNEKGNRGPALTMVIDDGRYASGNGEGIQGGAYIVEIAGFKKLTLDQAKLMMTPAPLFSTYIAHVEFDKTTSTYDFNVP